jgi:hypothetical protein
MSDNKLIMDSTFQDELRRFFKKNWEYQCGSVEDFMIDFQEFLDGEGFDLTSVIRWKSR